MMAPPRAKRSSSLAELRPVAACCMERKIRWSIGGPLLYFCRALRGRFTVATKTPSECMAANIFP